MANKRGNADAIKQYQFKPGQSGNPNGRPRTARAQLEEVLDDALLADARQNMEGDIARLKQENLPKYFDVLLGRIPKDKEVKDVNIRGEITSRTEGISEASEWARGVLGREMDRAVQAAVSNGSVLPDPVCPESSRH